MKNKVIAIVAGVVIFLAVAGYYWNVSRTPEDKELAAFQKEARKEMGSDLDELEKEYRESVKEDSIKEEQSTNSQPVSGSLDQAKAKEVFTNKGIIPKSGQKFYTTLAGEFINNFFKDIVSGVSVNEDNVVFSENLLKNVFKLNSVKRQSGDSNWLYARGLDDYAKTILSGGNKAEMVGYPLYEDAQFFANNCFSVRGTVLFKQAGNEKYWVGEYYVYIIIEGPDNKEWVSENDFSLNLKAVPDNNVKEIREKHLRG